MICIDFLSFKHSPLCTCTNTNWKTFKKISSSSRTGNTTLKMMPKGKNKVHPTLDNTLSQHSIFPVAFQSLFSQSSFWKYCFYFLCLDLGIQNPYFAPWQEVSYYSSTEFVFAYTDAQRRQWQPTPVLLPGKSHGRRSLVG